MMANDNAIASAAFAPTNVAKTLSVATKMSFKDRRMQHGRQSNNNKMKRRNDNQGTRIRQQRLDGADYKGTMKRQPRNDDVALEERQNDNKEMIYPKEAQWRKHSSVCQMPALSWRSVAEKVRKKTGSAQHDEATNNNQQQQQQL